MTNTCMGTPAELNCTDFLHCYTLPQAGFGSDLNRGWSDHDLGLKRVKTTGKLSFLVDNMVKGFEKVSVFPFPQLLKVRDIMSYS